MCFLLVLKFKAQIHFLMFLSIVVRKTDKRQWKRDKKQEKRQNFQRTEK